MIAALRPHRSTPPPADLAREAIPALTWPELCELPAQLAKRITLPAAIAAAAIATPAAAQQVTPTQPTAYQRAIAAGYKAAMLCSGIFTAGRTPAQIDADELSGIYPEYDAIVPTLTAEVDRGDGLVRVPWADGLPPRVAEYRVIEGCRLYPIDARVEPPAIIHSAVPAYLRQQPWPRPWPTGDQGVKPRPTPALAAALGRAFDGGSYGAGAKTTGVVILRDGKIAAERYARGWGPFAGNRTWSVGKSIAGTLVGMAVARHGVETAKPANIPEWHALGPDNLRATITLDQLLRMASGLRSGAAGNRTDAIYFGGVAVTDEATDWNVEALPGTRFRYANDDTLLAVRALRAELRDSDYASLPSLLFDTLGMTHTQAGTDWRGNYILSSQVWSTARDLARLGQFWLQDGVWQGKRLLPEGWTRYMTTPSGPQPADGPGYGATLWLFGPKQGLPEGSYAAQGNRGQYVMVIPSKRLVIVRRGEDPGAARFDIARFSADVAKALPENRASEAQKAAHEQRP